MKLQVADMRKIVEDKKTPAAELAAKYGVSVARIYELRRGRKDPKFPKALLAAKKSKIK
jgi:hypothetical protein